MSRFNPIPWPKSPVIWRYGIAVLSVTVALTLSRLPAVHLQDAPVSLFLCAVMFSAWFGGLGPGLLSAALSTLAFDYYFVPPMGFGASADEIPRLVIYMVSALVVGSLSAAQRIVTESLRRARDELKNSEQQWRDAFENNPTMYFMIDAGGTVVAVNPFGAEHLGYTVNELVGQPVLNVFYEPDRDAARQKVALCLEQLGRSLNWELRKVRKDGSVLWVRETARAVLRANNQAVLIACEDITEQKRTEEALRQAQADLAHVTRVTTMGELTASLAHEVNQPIAAAVTNANACLRWLGADTPNLEEARAAATRIVRDGTRAAEIISRIRLLFKKGAPERELVDVNEVIREMIILLHSETTRHSISVRTELAANLPRVMGDRVQLQQVLMNLVINGIDAMNDVDVTRELTIKLQTAENQHLLVSVSDTGVGIPPQQADKIFDAFFTTKLHGTGMGLSISRSIIESHGGRLWAADNSPRGTSFQFTLPTAADSRQVADSPLPVDIKRAA